MSKTTDCEMCGVPTRAGKRCETCEESAQLAQKWAQKMMEAERTEKKS